MRKHTDSNPQTPSSESLTNIANALTGLRLLLAPVIAWTITQQFWFIATLSILVAIATDVYDGRVARRLGLTSPFGGFFDHGTDAFFVSVSAWALAELGLITPWLWPCIAIAFLQYALDSKALAGQTLRTSLIGRYNGLGYYALVATAIGTQALQHSYTAGDVVEQPFSVNDDTSGRVSELIQFTFPVTTISSTPTISQTIFESGNTVTQDGILISES